MRLSSALLVAASALFSCACASNSSPADAAGLGVTDASFPDVPAVNACLAYGPAGAACMTEGVCGAGNVNDTNFLCLSSVEICCVPATALGVDAGVEMLPDGNFVVPRDAAKDGTMATSHDAGHDGGETAHDSGHDAGHVTEHDSGHDSGHVTEHDAGHDAKEMTKPDAERDAPKHD